MDGASQIPVGLQNHGSFQATSQVQQHTQWQPMNPSMFAGQQSPQAEQVKHPKAEEELATKAAEITVLRNRLQQFERDNQKLQAELLAQRQGSTHDEQSKRLQADVDRLSTELRYTSQDLHNSEDERRKLQDQLKRASEQTSEHQQQTQALLQSLQEDAKRAKLEAEDAKRAKSGASAGSTAAPSSQASAVSSISMPVPIHHSASRPIAAVATNSRQSQWRQDALLQELVRWDETAKVSASDAFALHGTVRRLQVPRELSKYNSWSQRQQSKEASTASELLAVGVAQRLQASVACRQWDAVQSGARFVQIWVGLCGYDAAQTVAGSSSGHIGKGAVALEALADALHSVVLDSVAEDTAPVPQASSNAPSAAPSRSDAQAMTQEKGRFPPGRALVRGTPSTSSDPSMRAATAGTNASLCTAEQQISSNFLPSPQTSQHAETCTAQLLAALTEITECLNSLELGAAVCVFRRPAIAALLAVETCGPLHCQCLQLLQVLLGNSELLKRVHFATCKENALLAAANLLVVPAVPARPSDEAIEGLPGIYTPSLAQDTAARLHCRVAALELFCRCLATSAAPEALLNLRGEPTVDGQPMDTVLQRIVLLAHHELLCLGLPVEQYHPLRQKLLELALYLMSSYAWRAAPWTTESTERKLTSPAPVAHVFGRMAPLLPSILDMVSRRSVDSGYYQKLLVSIIPLQVLLAPSPDRDVRGTDADSTISVWD